MVKNTVYDVQIVTPTHGNSLRNEVKPGISIHNVAKRVGRILKNIETSRISVSTATAVGTLGPAKKHRVLCCFRPGDIVHWNNRLEPYTHVVLLIHEQDKRNWKTSEEEILKSKKVATVTKDGKDFLESKGIKVTQVVSLPISPIPDKMHRKWIYNHVEKIDEPRVCLWLAPHVRKNSLQGLYATLEATLAYKESCSIEILCASIAASDYGESIKNFIKTIVTIPKAKIETLSLPSEFEKFKAFVMATTVVFPSFDEGYHIPLYEAEKFKSDIIATNCGANSEARKLARNIKLIDTRDIYILGSDIDEYPLVPARANVPKYDHMVKSIVNSMSQWENVKRRKMAAIKNGTYMSDLKRTNITQWTYFLGMKKRKSPGSALLDVI